MKDNNTLERDERSLDEILAGIEDTMRQMESGEGSLEKMFSLYEKGISDIKAAGEKIDAVEKKLEVLREEDK